jgi:hypothetical protein
VAYCHKCQLAVEKRKSRSRVCNRRYLISSSRRSIRDPRSHCLIRTRAFLLSVQTVSAKLAESAWQLVCGAFYMASNPASDRRATDRMSWREPARMFGLAVAPLSTCIDPHPGSRVSAEAYSVAVGRYTAHQSLKPPRPGHSKRMIPCPFCHILKALPPDARIRTDFTSDGGCSRDVFPGACPVGNIRGLSLEKRTAHGVLRLSRRTRSPASRRTHLVLVPAR